MSGTSWTWAARVRASQAPLAPRTSPPLPATGSATVLSTLFTTSVWRKSMPGRNAIGHAVAHTWSRTGCYVRPTGPFRCITGCPDKELPEGGPLGLRFNPAPGWPPPPPGFVPPPHWQPDPSWPPAPPGWQLWVDDDDPDPRRPGEFGGGS